jgi:hypothetical protein
VVCNLLQFGQHLSLIRTNWLQQSSHNLAESSGIIPNNAKND